MIQLLLDWREVLWWMQGGMAGVTSDGVCMRTW